VKEKVQCAVEEFAPSQHSVLFSVTERSKTPPALEKNQYSR